MAERELKKTEEPRRELLVASSNNNTVVDESSPPKRPRTRAWKASLEVLEWNRNQNFDPDKCSLDVLTQDDLLEVFKYLDIKTRFKIRRVSKKWNTAFEESMRSLKTLDLCKVLSSIDFSDNPRRPLDSLNSWMTIIKYCSKQLEEFRMYSYVLERFTKKRIQNLYHYCPDILELQLCYTSWRSGSIGSLACFTKLQSLFLHRARIGNSEKDLGRAFASLENLNQVHLTCCEISGTSLTKLHPEKLEYLDISESDSITPAAIETFFSREWSVLQDLVVSRLNLKMDNFMELVVAKAPRLISLDVSYCNGRMKSGMEKLVQLENFRELRCVGVRGPQTYEYLSALVSADHKLAAQRMEKLSLCSLVSEKLLLVSKLVGLKELHLCAHQNAGFGEQEDPIEVEEAISAIATGCTNLERLSLSRLHGLTDECLALIGRCCSLLSHLFFYDGRRVTNAGLESLVEGMRANSQRPKGRNIRINVTGCFQVEVRELEIADSWVSVEERQWV